MKPTKPSQLGTIVATIIVLAGTACVVIGVIAVAKALL